MSAVRVSFSKAEWRPNRNPGIPEPEATVHCTPTRGAAFDLARWSAGGWRVRRHQRHLVPTVISRRQWGRLSDARLDIRAAFRGGLR